jgi:hypothetical protein
MAKFEKGKSNPGRQFKPGQSGNPGGRPKMIVRVAEAARQHTWEAIETLVEVMRDKAATASARVMAACAVLDRAWGKPAQSLDVNVRSDDVRTLTDAQLLDLINQQREHREAGEGTLPAAPDTTKLN